MKAIITAILAAVLAAILVAGAQTKGEAERMFKAAKNAELVDGNLKAAIEQYDTIVAKFSKTDRAASADALVRMAECYTKLGDTQAHKIYERVLRDYADQKEAAAVARARLGGSAPENDGRIVVRQVWSGDNVNLQGRPSPDGRYFVHTDSESGDLVIRDLKSGESRLLTRDAGAGGHYVSAFAPVFSPDGSQVAYQWWSDPKTSLRLIGSDGSNMRVLMDSTQRPIPVAWSPDGKWIALGLWNQDNSTQIALISAVDGAVTQLKSTGWKRPGIGGFSPDGRFLVYSLPDSNPSASDGGIFAIAADGGQETALVQGPATDKQPRWTPDGRAVVFASDRSGANGLWSIRVANGKPQGSPELVRANVGDIYPFGFDQNGSYYYGTYNRQVDVYFSGIDPETLDTVTEPVRVADKFVGSNWGPAWSPDGQFIAFFRALDSSPSRAIVVRSVATGEERTLPGRIQQGGYVAGYFAPQWFPDGRSLLVMDTSDSRWAFKRVDLEGGNAQVVLSGSKVRPVATLSPDGRMLYYSVPGGRVPESNLKMLHLMKKNLETGEEAELYHAQSPAVSFFGLAVSPDGARLSFMRNDLEGGKRTLLTISTDGGDPREMYRGAHNKPIPFAAVWTRDGRHLLFASNLDGRGQLWAIPADGGEPRPLDITMRQILYPAVSPDGRRVAFTGAQSKAELWVIDNLLAETQPSH